jgi:putative phosphoribosyl transferase
MRKLASGTRKGDGGLAAPGSAEVVYIPAGSIALEGELVLPARADGLVLFAHGSGSSRHSPRNQFVAGKIQAGGVGTLLFDLLTPAEEASDTRDGHLRFNLGLLADRLISATQWARRQPAARRLGLGYFGASTGAAAALMAAANLGSTIGAVVSRGGRPDLAGTALERVTAPTLLIVGGRDEGVLSLNEGALARLRCPKELVVVPGATHLFEESGTLEQVAALAAGWFGQHLRVH